MHIVHLVLAATLGQSAAAQQIWDITKWDRTKLFTSLAPSTPINFVTPGPAASADIIVTETSVFQTINGFGGSLTDSSALTLNNLKTKNQANYWSILGHMFSVADGADASGFSYVRVPIGASDFSAKLYSLDDVSGDTSFNSFNINNAPSYLYSVLLDIISINPALKARALTSFLHALTPPAGAHSTMEPARMDENDRNNEWRDDTVEPCLCMCELSIPLTSFNVESIADSKYLLKAVQGFQGKGISVYAISVQNEPENSNPSYPTCTMTPAVEGQIGAALRTLLNQNGLSGVKLVGYEHNWNDAAAYPVTLMNDDGGSYDGVAFHCYQGTYTQMASFHNAWPSKNVYFTECSGTFGSDWWSDIKWYMDNLWVGSMANFAGVGLMYNLALDGNGNPILPGTTSCGGGCRPLVTVNSDGSFSYNQEFYAMAQASKAIIPKDAGGPWGRRIGVSVQGSLAWALRVAAYSTKRISSTDFNRYSIVVLNWDDSASTTWNPVDVTATIEFRGMQATYTFPVGVTTLWWFAAPNAQGLVTEFNATTVPINNTAFSSVALSSSAKASSASAHSGSSSVVGSNTLPIPSVSASATARTSFAKVGSSAMPIASPAVQPHITSTSVAVGTPAPSAGGAHANSILPSSSAATLVSNANNGTLPSGNHTVLAANSTLAGNATSSASNSTHATALRH
ncbi:glycoside hydrolase superfamily [Mycena pura]|uniref:Glycoside hydrolase superfamily n=1 Tax=Mycena pura TaxID=153505 RepID=A0AAD6YEI4_9AGAR|nr:glycoside hydrolase superfamily [Mycena pura]